MALVVACYETWKLAATHPEFEVKLNANASLGGVGFAILLVLAMVVPLASGVAFAWQGAWMILPFAGLEMVLLVGAWLLNALRERRFERIHLRDGRIVVEVGLEARTERFEFNAAWVRLVEQAGEVDYRLSLEAHGRSLEIGRHLAPEGRRALASELREKLAK
jgi:uncharacterized membrane protein